MCSNCNADATVSTQGDEYILYCHPNSQKMPTPSKLREWYLQHVLAPASALGIVEQVSTVHDTYLPGGRHHKLHLCSTTRMPYLEGDCWPGEACAI